MNSRILVKRSPVYVKCPSCNFSDVLRRSNSRTVTEYLISHITFFRTFRCRYCGWRGYKSTLTFTYQSFKTLLFYIALGIGAALIVREVLKRFT